MPHQARLDAPGTVHHVMIRGIEGKSIFRDNRVRLYSASDQGRYMENSC
jgi:putative transposase